MLIANCDEEVGCAMMVVEEGMRRRRRRWRSDFCHFGFGWHPEGTKNYQRMRGSIWKALFSGDSKLFQM
jgi:hypothetical protein